jgi:hypothetical protein
MDKSLSTGDGGGGTCVANHGIPTNDLFSSKLLIPLFSQYLIKLCKRSTHRNIKKNTKIKLTLTRLEYTYVYFVILVKLRDNMCYRN